jgi:hypothetical protein
MIDVPENTFDTLENPIPLFDDISIAFACGHTDCMMLPHIKTNFGELIFCADLIPSPHHIAMPWVMAYDTRPLITMQEKEIFLPAALQKNAILFYEHDKDIAASKLIKNERGNITFGEQFLF